MKVSDEVERMPGRVVCITFAEPSRLGAFERELGLAFPIYGDPGRRAYAAFGFGRGSVRRVWLHPRVWAAYARLVLHGRRPRRSGQDTLQLGGNVVLDARGRVRWVYRARGPDDRPEPHRISEQLARERQD